jgi:translation initiation factor IF-2
MAETKDSGEKTLSVTPGKTLSLKGRPGVEAGTVRQSFSHGRTKQVVVEKVVKRRVLAPGETARPEPAEKPPVAPAPVAAPPAQPAKAAPSGRAVRPPIGKGPQSGSTSPKASPAAGVVLRTLTEEQIEARARALEDSRVREEEERKIAEIEAKARAEREEREQAEREAAEARKKEEEARRQYDSETRRRSEEDARRRLAGEPPLPRPEPSERRSARVPSPRSAAACSA